MALATVLAACGGGSDDSSGEDPQSVVDSATMEGVESGNLDVSLNLTAEGKEGGQVDLTIAGPFQSGGEEELPQFDIDVTAEGSMGGEDIDFEGGLTLLSEEAFVGYDGTEYEVDRTTFGYVRSAIEKAQQEQGGAADQAAVTACQEAVAKDFKVGDLMSNLENEGSVEVNGEAATKVSGDLDVPSAIDAVIEITKEPACASQFEAAGPLPLDELEAAKGELGEAIKKAHIDVYVGEDDITRRVVAEMTVEPPAGSSDEAPESLEVAFDLTLSEVNEQQTIEPPSGAKPLSELFQKLNVNPIQLLELTQGGGLEDLLEGAAGGGSGSGGGGSGSGGASSGIIDCLKEATTSADLQRCQEMR